VMTVGGMAPVVGEVVGEEAGEGVDEKGGVREILEWTGNSGLAGH